MDKIRLNKKVMLSALGILAVLVLAAGAGIGLRLLQNDKAAKENSPAYVGESLPEAVNEAQELRVSGDTDASLKKIDEALSEGDTSKKEKYQLYIQQGNVHYDKKDVDAAIASYLQAETFDSTFEITSLLADMYKEIDNKPKAIEYYKKSIPLIPKSPMQQFYKTDAEQKIQALGGQV